MPEALKNRPMPPVERNAEEEVTSLPPPRCRMETHGQAEKSVFMQVVENNPRGVDETVDAYNKRISEISWVQMTLSSSALIPSKKIVPQDPKKSRKRMESHKKILDSIVGASTLVVHVALSAVILGLAGNGFIPPVVVISGFWGTVGAAAVLLPWFVSNEIHKGVWEDREIQRNKWLDAVRKGNKVELLKELENGENPSGAEGFSTPLHVAGNAEVTELLLNYGADPNVVDDKNKTPLDKALDRGDLESARLLLGAGANINAQDKTGKTALFRAVLKGDAKAVAFLRENNADMDIPNKVGRTAWEFLDRLQEKKQDPEEPVVELKRRSGGIPLGYRRGAKPATKPPLEHAKLELKP